MAPNIGMHDVRSQSFHYHRGGGLPTSGAKIRPTSLSRELFGVVNVYKPLPINPIVDANPTFPFFLETALLAITTM